MQNKIQTMFSLKNLKFQCKISAPGNPRYLQYVRRAGTVVAEEEEEVADLSISTTSAVGCRPLWRVVPGTLQHRESSLKVWSHNRRVADLDPTSYKGEGEGSSLKKVSRRTFQLNVWIDIIFLQERNVFFWHNRTRTEVTRISSVTQTSHVWRLPLWIFPFWRL